MTSMCVQEDAEVYVACVPVRDVFYLAKQTDSFL